ncbi:LEA type 2 family protein [Sphaerotilaceae bacterium SBD11-9]
MDRRAWCQAVAAFGVAGLLQGCASLSAPLQVNVVGIEPLPGEGMEIRLAVKLRIQNPNDTPIDYDGISLRLDLRDTTFATGVSAERGSVPRFGEALISVPVSVSAMTAMRQFIGLATSKDAKPTNDYALYGRLSGTGLGGVSFESKGVINLAELLQRQ